jgi:hypothetical protein
MFGDTSPLLTHDDVDLLVGWQFLGEMRWPPRCSPGCAPEPPLRNLSDARPLSGAAFQF